MFLSLQVTADTPVNQTSEAKQLNSRTFYGNMRDPGSSESARSPVSSQPERCSAGGCSENIDFFIL